MASKMQQAFEEKAFGKPVLVPDFFDHATIDPVLTGGYGLTIYRSRTYVKIKTVGRKDNTVRLATEEDVNLFHEHYKKYKEESEFTSIPMEAVAGFNIANQFTLRDLGVTTVEELAGYSGALPTASLKLMRHSAEYLCNCMLQYQPMEFHNDQMRKPDESIQTQRQVLPTQDNEPIHQDSGGDHGGGVQQLGVTLSETGEILQFNGKDYQEEGSQEEGSQEEGSQERVINFY